MKKTQITMNQPQEQHSIYYPLQNLSFAELLLDDEKEKLISSSNLVEYSKRDVILKQNARVSDIPIVIKGLVKISREMRKGKNIILRIAKKGTILGLSSIIDGETYEYSVTALEPCSILFIDTETFKWLLEKNGRFSFDILKQLSNDNTFNIHRLSSLLYKQLPGRVADIILYFSQEIFMNNSFTIPLTRQEIAELAGTTKESLIRTLSEFKHDKIIDMNRNSFSIISLDIIKTLSRLG